MQQVLAHSQISLTANLYTHVLPALLKDAAMRMDAVLSSHASGRLVQEGQVPAGNR